MAEDIDLPSLDVVANRVAAERETMNSHAESLDSKAGVVLGSAPPPFRPNEDLIGYIERGQKRPVRPAPPSEKR